MALRSSVWDYFIRIPNIQDKVKCNVCTSVLSARGSSTSNMTRHLRLKHPTIKLKESRSRPSGGNEEEDDAPLNIEASATPMDCEEVPQASCSASTNTRNRTIKQSTISEFTVKPMSATTRTKIDEQLLRFIIKGYHSFNMMECPEFKKNASSSESKL